MIHIICGGDELSVSEAASSMKELVGTQELWDVNIVAFSGPEVSLGELTATCDTVPFLAERRLVLVRGLLGMFEPQPGRRPVGAGSRRSLGEWEALAAYLPNIPDSTELVFVDGQLSRSNPLLAVIGPLAKVQTFPLPTGPGLVRWIQDRAAVHDALIDPAAARALADNVGPNPWAIDSELQKLSLFRYGESIRRQDVDEMVADVREASIFAAVDAVIEGRPGQAIRLVRRLMDSGRTLPSLLAMLARQVRLLLLAKDLRAQGVAGPQMGGRLSLSGYPLRKTLDQEKRFTHEQLAHIHESLVQLDLSAKTLPIDERVALETLIAELAGPVSASRRG